MSRPIGVADIKNRLVGLDSWFAAAQQSQSQYDDAKIESLIPGWVREFERDTLFRINQVQCVSSQDGKYGVYTTGSGTISSNGRQVTGVGTTFTSLSPDGAYLKVGARTYCVDVVQTDTSLLLEVVPRTAFTTQSFSVNSMEVLDEFGYPYYSTNGTEFFNTTLRQKPLLSVQRLRLMYNGVQLIYTVPPNWYSIDKKSARFYVLPNAGATSLMAAQAVLLSYGIAMSDHLPNFLFFDYQAGLPTGWETSHEWSDILQVLSEYCANKVLEDIAHVVGPGVTGKNVSAAGLSQSLNYDRFQTRKAELIASTQKFIANLVSQETPIMFGFI